MFGVTREMAVVETHAVLRSGDPVLTFYRGGELDGDETNWFGPNPRVVEEMLRAVGFSRVERVFAGPAFA